MTDANRASSRPHNPAGCECPPGLVDGAFMPSGGAHERGDQSFVHHHIVQSPSQTCNSFKPAINRFLRRAASFLGRRQRKTRWHETNRTFAGAFLITSSRSRTYASSIGLSCPSNSYTAVPSARRTSKGSVLEIESFDNIDFIDGEIRGIVARNCRRRMNEMLAGLLNLRRTLVHRASRQRRAKSCRRSDAETLRRAAALRGQADVHEFVGCASGGCLVSRFMDHGLQRRLVLVGARAPIA
jgi:hypothetical protein